ncbi:MAG: bacillithiol system redox-active protein YtxJ [Desulfosporosinus sp.]|nr:bacillithiol system redox-active protein YtxJ [Desulfosporosinus sp.]
MAEFKEITCSQDFKDILAESCQRKIILFKHSTTCPISARAWQEVQNFIRDSSNEVLVAMLKVIESRPVCNQVAEELGVKHQSPQVLLLSNQKVLWHTSHQSVTLNRIKQALDGNLVL